MQDENRSQASAGGAGQPRWGQLQHQFCKPEELAGSLAGPSSAIPDTVGWPGDPPSVTIQPSLMDPAALGGAINSVG